MPDEKMCLYSPLAAPLEAEWLAAHVEGAECHTETDADTGDCLSMVIQWPKVKLEIYPTNVYTDGEFVEHLYGFVGYTGQELAQDQMDEWTYRVMDRILTVKQSLGMVIEPGFDEEGYCADFIHRIAVSSRALIFWQGVIFDPYWKLLLGGDRSRDDESSLGQAEDAHERKQRIEKHCAAKNIPTCESLVLLPSADEVLPRPAREIAERAYVVTVLAARAERNGLSAAEARQMLTDNGMLDHLTPEEEVFLAQTEPTDHTRAQFSWRYEAVAALLWSLGMLNELPYPSKICDVPAVAKLAAGLRDPMLKEQLSLRDLDEILDEADKHYRYHWAAVSARLEEKPAPADLDEGVIVERRHALHWVLRLKYEEWDDVTKDT